MCGQGDDLDAYRREFGVFVGQVIRRLFLRCPLRRAARRRIKQATRRLVAMVGAPRCFLSCRLRRGPNWWGFWRLARSKLPGPRRCLAWRVVHLPNGGPHAHYEGEADIDRTDGLSCVGCGQGQAGGGGRAVSIVHAGASGAGATSPQHLLLEAQADGLLEDHEVAVSLDFEKVVVVEHCALGLGAAGRAGCSVGCVARAVEGPQAVLDLGRGGA